MKAQHPKATLEQASRPSQVPKRHAGSDWLKVTVRPSEMEASAGMDRVANVPAVGAHARVDPMTLSALLHAPARASEVPLGQIPALVLELASEQAALSAVQGVLTARLLMLPAERGSDTGGDRLLTAEEVAQMLGVTKRWVQRRARRLPFSKRISVRSVRYSEAGLKRWMAHRQAPKP